MARCSFCGKIIEKGSGKLFVFKSGKTNDFCSNKCEKNLLKLKRKPRKYKWTHSFEKGVKKEEKKVTEK
ncbi:MAG: 50S ribosomal protein L24e [Candidatus Nanoarchaeia archaeon]|nr:50S ribosomal protein L24e [Candidatus Nanoarchaeia archaeon]